MRNLILHTIKREVLLSCRQSERLLQPFLFFILMLMLFVLAMGPDKNTLNQLAPGMVWLSVLLANLLAFDHLFKEDYKDGCLEQFILHAKPLPVFIGVKIFAHWLTTCLPLILICPVIMLAYGMSLSGLMWLLISLILGTPILVFVGGLISALIVGLKQNGVLLALLVLPLLIPVLIFGTGMVTAGEQGFNVSGQIAIFLALLLLCITFMPVVIVAALKGGIND